MRSMMSRSATASRRPGAPAAAPYAAAYFWRGLNNPFAGRYADGVDCHTGSPYLGCPITEIKLGALTRASSHAAE